MTELEQMIAAVLRDHGITGDPTLIAELANCLRYTEWWTDAQVAAHVGVPERTVRYWTYRHLVDRVTLSSAEQVRMAKAGMPGRGARTDLDRKARASG